MSWFVEWWRWVCATGDGVVDEEWCRVFNVTEKSDLYDSLLGGGVRGV